MSKKKEPKKPLKLPKGVKIVLVEPPEPHRGNIPREEIYRAVREVIAERLKREAEEARIAEARGADVSETP